MKRAGRPAVRFGTASALLALLLSTPALAATIVGTKKNDVLRGTAGGDTINGKGGSDTLYGLGGNDLLLGGSGNDTLIGGRGADKLDCGPGHDVAIVDAKDNVSPDCETIRGALPSISVADASAAEGNSGTASLSFQVTLSRPVTWRVSVAYATADGTAAAGSDYTSVQGRVAFAPSEATQTINVPIVGDTLVEPNESLTLRFSHAANARVARGSATGTIENDDYEWHRLNNDRRNPAPEHERFHCAEGADWTCMYDKVPEPALNFHWDDQKATFTGKATPQGQWTCPAWFPNDVCANVDRVAQGVATFPPAFSARLDLVVATVGSQVRLYVYWVGQFVCPWYQTFDEALAANPFPQPFNGSDWPSQDCTFAR
jgi:Calx-beta domain/RTX calcium-binding nonapeptide repeat (4 copies)